MNKEKNIDAVLESLQEQQRTKQRMNALLDERMRMMKEQQFILESAEEVEEDINNIEQHWNRVIEERTKNGGDIFRNKKLNDILEQELIQIGKLSELGEVGRIVAEEHDIQGDNAVFVYTSNSSSEAEVIDNVISFVVIQYSKENPSMIYSDGQGSSIIRQFGVYNLQDPNEFIQFMEEVITTLTAINDEETNDEIVQEAESKSGPHGNKRLGGRRLRDMTKKELSENVKAINKVIKENEKKLKATDEGDSNSKDTKKLKKEISECYKVLEILKEQMEWLKTNKPINESDKDDGDVDFDNLDDEGEKDEDDDFNFDGDKDEKDDKGEKGDDFYLEDEPEGSEEPTLSVEDGNGKTVETTFTAIRMQVSDIDKAVSELTKHGIPEEAIQVIPDDNQIEESDDEPTDNSGTIEVSATYTKELEDFFKQRGLDLEKQLGGVLDYGTSSDNKEGDEDDDKGDKGEEDDEPNLNLDDDNEGSDDDFEGLFDDPTEDK